MPGYHSLIKGHGIIAAITFLFIVPMAILIARFYHKNPRMALRLHIWLQIMTVLLSTALFVLGFQAVGAERSLTNPHHGIGIALYTMVMAQAFAGCLIHRTEKGKERFKIPLKLMVGDPMSNRVPANRRQAPPMDRKSYCDTRNRASSAWPDLVWLAKDPFHPVCCLVSCASNRLFLPELEEPAGHGL